MLVRDSTACVFEFQLGGGFEKGPAEKFGLFAVSPERLSRRPRSKAVGDT